MSTLHSMRKRVAKSSLMFPAEMYSNLVGSLVITSYIMSEEKPDVAEIKKRWFRLRKKGMDYWIDDPDFIDKTTDMFGLKAPYGNMAYVVSGFNSLFLPYVEVDGEKQVLAIREDGMYPASARHGRIYPVERGMKDAEQGSKEEA